MKLRTQIIVISFLGLAIMSSTAYSGTPLGSSGTTTGTDHLIKSCLACNQIPAPVISCTALSFSQAYCGSEEWYHAGSQDCKQFTTVTVNCESGGSQVFTTESWSGAGAWCDAGENPSCQTL
jgi:hypothetical protein